MRKDNITASIRQHWYCYLIGGLITAGLKYFYSQAGCEALIWVLAPTARWAGALSGLSFSYLPDMGYVNEAHRFLIAASCSGLQFMIITIATLIFSLAHRMKTPWQRICLIGLSLLSAYFVTILVNGLRITLAIYLPAVIFQENTPGGWLTPDRLHTLIGIAVYFTALCLIYRMADHAVSFITNKTGTAEDCAGLPHAGDTAAALIRNLLPPAFWYFFIALGVPFLNGAYVKNAGGFTEYASLITICGLIITALLSAVTAVRKYNIPGRR